jgi:hypothetical protein
MQQIRPETLSEVFVILIGFQSVAPCSCLQIKNEGVVVNQMVLVYFNRLRATLVFSLPFIAYI